MKLQFAVFCPSLLLSLIARPCEGAQLRSQLVQHLIGASSWGREKTEKGDVLLELGRASSRAGMKRQWLSDLVALNREPADDDNGTAVRSVLHEFLRLSNGSAPGANLSVEELQKLEKMEDRTATDIAKLKRAEKETASELEALEKQLETREKELEAMPADHAGREAKEKEVNALKETVNSKRAVLHEIGKLKGKLLDDLGKIARRRGGGEVEVAGNFGKHSTNSLDDALSDFEATATIIPPALQEMGVKFNHVDDWFSFFLALVTNVVVLIVCILVFSCLRQRFRLVYQKNNWDNWGHSDPSERTAIVDGDAKLFDERKNWNTSLALGKLPKRLHGTFWDWITGSVWLCRTEAMLIQFCNLGITVFLGISLPFCLILAPLHVFFGGNAAGSDYLSWQGFANVEQGSKLCWLHAFLVWYVVLFVDTRIYKFQKKFVKLRVHWLQKLSHIESCTILVENIPLRHRTVAGLRKYMNNMFAGREVVHEVHLLAYTEQLESLIATRDVAKVAMERAKERAECATRAKAEAEAARLEAGEHEDYRLVLATPRILLDMMNSTLEDLEAEYSTHQDEVVAERYRLKKIMARVEAKAEDADEEEWDDEAPSQVADGDPVDMLVDQTDGDTSMDEAQSEAAVKIQRSWRARKMPAMLLGLKSSLGFKFRHIARPFALKSELETAITETYSSTAFVTFNTRYDAIMARRIIPYTPDREEFVVSEAPDPSDVNYNNLKKDALHWKTWNSVGIALIILLFLMFLPTIAFISSFSNLNNLSSYSPRIEEFAAKNPKLAGMWNGIAGALGLNIVLGFLPTVLVLISQACFKQTANAWAQLRLQKLYFLFLVVFQLLIVSMASSMMNAMVDFAQNPLSLVDRLSMGMCRTTHFFLSVFVIQWAAMGMEHTRYVQLIKYMLFKKTYATSLDAAIAAEPEDQDYYGIGARSARVASIFVIGLAFVSLCPLISLMSLISFCLLRVLLGYHVVYAETRKADIGGHFWVTMLKHCQVGMIIYVICMTGVLAERSGSRYPALIAASSLVYVIESMIVFDGKFFWESICHEQVMQAQREAEEGKAVDVREPTRESYIQPELIDEELYNTPRIVKRTPNNMAAIGE
mmetsp:Transcript_34819/g.110582  ORF Transcript_34819/g.110582 Transcript_34819/m.110582 type:complete len:1103 (+) Transcript_34819:78-3386(+)